MIETTYSLCNTSPAWESWQVSQGHSVFHNPKGFLLCRLNTTWNSQCSVWLPQLIACVTHPQHELVSPQPWRFLSCSKVMSIAWNSQGSPWLKLPIACDTSPAWESWQVSQGHPAFHSQKGFLLCRLHTVWNSQCSVGLPQPIACDTSPAWESWQVSQGHPAFHSQKGFLLCRLHTVWNSQCSVGLPQPIACDTSPAWESWQVSQGHPAFHSQKGFLLCSNGELCSPPHILRQGSPWAGTASSPGRCPLGMGKAECFANPWKFFILFPQLPFILLWKKKRKWRGKSYTLATY